VAGFRSEYVFGKVLWASVLWGRPVGLGNGVIATRATCSGDDGWILLLFSVWRLSVVWFCESEQYTLIQAWIGLLF